MAEKPTKKPIQVPFALKIIFGLLLAVVLTCGGIYLWFYLTINDEQIRGDFVAWQAKGRVEQIYDRIRNVNFDGVTLLSEEKPRSGTYSYGLSDGAFQIAYVWAHQTYTSAVPFDEVSTAYQEQFTAWGWETLPLNSQMGFIRAAFSKPEDVDLIVGICPLVETDLSQYTIFFDFDESSCEWRSTRLGCLSDHYCES